MTVSVWSCCCGLDTKFLLSALALAFRNERFLVLVNLREEQRGTASDEGMIDWL
jgi:hypothetical protein